MALGEKPPKDATMHRARRFEVLRKNGNDPHQRTTDCSFSLMDAMASKIDACRASQALYRAPFWEWLAGVEPCLLRLHRWIERELAARGYVRLNRLQAEIWRFALPESRELEWSQHEVKWQLHTWGSAFDDLTLSAALVLEARLAGAYGVIERWMFPLEQHLALLTRQLDCPRPLHTSGP